jgi:hypothetical protein
MKYTDTDYIKLYQDSPIKFSETLLDRKLTQREYRYIDKQIKFGNWDILQMLAWLWNKLK